MEPRPVQLIAELVTPAVMMSSAGLLLLGLHSKYSSIVSRVRHIVEKRAALEQEEEHTQAVANLTDQIRLLLHRAWYVRNAVFCLYISILLMIATSLCYALDALAKFSVGRIPVAVFVLGILVLFVGCIFALMEVQYAYRVISLEVERYGASDKR